MSSDSVEHFLSTLPLFGGLSDAALAKIAGTLEEHRLDPGTVVCRQDEPSRAMYILREGEVTLRRTNTSGRVVKMLRLRPGDFFGETTLVEIHPSFGSAVVESPATLYAVTNKHLYLLYREDLPAYALVLNNFCRELSRRLRMAEARICEHAELADDERTQIATLPLPVLRKVRG